ncbi:hypothetical protein HKX48_000229 [Thoreauomyces humboldtii]|nr:hypothetical protein HKX48_000229 [Thoreauomyces humboldtii]
MIDVDRPSIQRIRQTTEQYGKDFPGAKVREPLAMLNKVAPRPQEQPRTAAAKSRKVARRSLNSVLRNGQNSHPNRRATNSIPRNLDRPDPTTPSPPAPIQKTEHHNAHQRIKSPQRPPNFYNVRISSAPVFLRRTTIRPPSLQHLERRSDPTLPSPRPPRPSTPVAPAHKNEKVAKSLKTQTNPAPKHLKEAERGLRNLAFDEAVQTSPAQFQQGTQMTPLLSTESSEIEYLEVAMQTFERPASPPPVMEHAAAQYSTSEVSQPFLRRENDVPVDISPQQQGHQLPQLPTPADLKQAMRKIVKHELSKRKKESSYVNPAVSDRISTFEERLAQWVQAEVLVNSITKIEKLADATPKPGEKVESPVKNIWRDEQFTDRIVDSILEETLTDQMAKIAGEVLAPLKQVQNSEVPSPRIVPLALTDDSVQRLAEELLDETISSETRAIASQVLSAMPLTKSTKATETAAPAADDKLLNNALLTELRLLRQDAQDERLRRAVKEDDDWKASQEAKFRALELQFRANLHRESVVVVDSRSPAPLLHPPALAAPPRRSDLAPPSNVRVAVRTATKAPTPELDCGSDMEALRRSQHEDHMARLHREAEQGDLRRARNLELERTRKAQADLLRRNLPDPDVSPQDPNPITEALRKHNAEEAERRDFLNAEDARLKEEEDRLRKLRQVQERANREAAEKQHRAAEDSKKPAVTAAVEKTETDSVENALSMATDQPSEVFPSSLEPEASAPQPSRKAETLPDIVLRLDLNTSSQTSGEVATIGSSEVSSIGLTTLSMLMSDGEVLGHIYSEGELVPSAPHPHPHYRVNHTIPPMAANNSDPSGVEEAISDGMIIPPVPTALRYHKIHDVVEQLYAIPPVDTDDVSTGQIFRHMHGVLPRAEDMDYGQTDSDTSGMIPPVRLNLIPDPVDMASLTSEGEIEQGVLEAREGTTLSSEGVMFEADSEDISFSSAR